MEIAGPRWKGKNSEDIARSNPLSEIVKQLQNLLTHSENRAMIAGKAVLLSANDPLSSLLSRACFGQPFVTSENHKEKQWFQLSPEEAFFMGFDLNCLKMVDEEGEVKGENEIWENFKSRVSGFPELYAAYAHLRRKNWVVRSGSQYGVDFVAYRHHPTLVHSEYAVVVETIADEDCGGRIRRLNKWPELQGALRVSGGVAKTLLVITVAGGFGDYPAWSPERWEIEEKVIRRWVPEHCRESDDEPNVKK